MNFLDGFLNNLINLCSFRLSIKKNWLGSIWLSKYKTTQKKLKFSNWFFQFDIPD
jgi:hypothetical protein